MSKMEATIGPIVTKLDSILNKIDDAKRIKMKKKETMQRLIENIEDDDQSKLIIIFFVYVWFSSSIQLQWTKHRKLLRSEK